MGLWASGLVWAAPISYLPASGEAMGASSLFEAQPKLTGWAARIGIVELGEPMAADQLGQSFMPNFEHRALANVRRAGIHYFENPFRPVCYSEHATMIAGILAGNDPMAGTPSLGGGGYRGWAPEATVEVFEANWFIFNQILTIKPELMNCDVLNISWASNQNDVVTLWWQRGIDSLVAQAECTIVAGCGNDQARTAVSKPSWGYNVISVGSTRALGEFPDFLRYLAAPTEVSCFGPTSDGRAKPDCIAPGVRLGPVARDSSSYAGDEVAAGYSSFAAPQVSGIAALLVDAARQEKLVGGDDPRVIKALILNGANKLVGWHKGLCTSEDDHQAVLDYRQGAGVVNAWNSYQQLVAGSLIFGRPSGWDLNTLALQGNDPNAERVYLIEEPVAVDTEIKATLCWYRRYTNDQLYSPEPLAWLILELWAVDDQGRLSERLDYSDSRLDNVQHIYYRCGEPRRVALVVAAGEGQDAAALSETYALAVTTEQPNWPGDMLAADFNGDGRVDMDDLMQMLKTWGQYRSATTPELPGGLSWLAEDINADGRLDQQDLNLFGRQWQLASPWAAR